MNKKVVSHNRQKLIEKVTPALPWLAGAGFAVSHIAISSNCSVPKEGRCSTCGGCVIALGALVTWALWKKNRANELEVIVEEPKTR